MSKKDWVAYLFLACSGILVAVHFSNRAITSISLAELFEMGTQCNSLYRLMPSERYVKKGEQAEDECYVRQFGAKMRTLPNADQAEYLSRTLDAFKAAKRLDQTTAAMLSETIVSLPRETSAEARFELIESVLSIAEACTDLKSDVLVVLSYLQAGMFEGLAQNPENQQKAELVAKRYQSIKDRWIIQEQEVSTYLAKRIQHEL